MSNPNIDRGVSLTPWWLSAKFRELGVRTRPPEHHNHHAVVVVPTCRESERPKSANALSSSSLPWCFGLRTIFLLFAFLSVASPVVLSSPAEHSALLTNLVSNTYEDEPSSSIFVNSNQTQVLHHHQPPPPSAPRHLRHASHVHHEHRHAKHHHHTKRNNPDPIDPQSSVKSVNQVPEFSSITPISSYITSNKSINFTHIELDPVTGAVYVGAVNWVFQLHSESLRVQHAVRTGPIRDSVSCAPADCSGVTDQNVVQITNNVNKVLLVEPYARMLIVCGSVHQGACARHRLEDISTHEDLVPVPVAANDENSSTIAFVGPARYFGVQLTPILYVAATDSRLGPYRDMVPAISGRSLESGSRLFNIIERSFADSARVDISSHLRDYFLVRYVYGFYAGDYVYIAQVQRKSYLRAQEELGYVSRLARVCVSDAGFHTYAEITLECVVEPGYSVRDRRPGHRYRAGSFRNRNSGSSSSSSENTSETPTEEFNLLQDAILVKAGSDLSDALNIERGSQVLIGVFTTAIDHTQRPGAKSAVCVFPVADIEQRFAENIHLCYNGSVYSRNMDYIAGSVNQCPEPGTGNVFNFCNEAVKLNGSLALRSQAATVYRDGTVLTAVTAAITGQHTVAFLGTNYGSIKKVLLQSGDVGEQFDEVVVDQSQAILADLFVDAEQNPKHLIAASPYKVVKLPVETCVQHDTCDQCLQARNPYCGWCSLQKRCTIKSDCVNQSPTNSQQGSPSLLPNHHHLMSSSPTYRHHHPSSSMSSSSSSSLNSNTQILFSTPRWLSLETSQCIDFQAIKPEFMPRDHFAPVELIINQLPPLPYGANYLCVFEQSSPIPATVTRHGLTCQTPSLVSRPSIPVGQDHMSVNLAVRSSETDTDFIHRSFVFFDCTVHKSCKSCVMSAWNCNWCMHENLCTYNTSLCTRRVIVGENNPQNSLIKGVQHCPSFSIDTPILVPNGARKELRVEVRNLIPSQDGFQCIVEVEQAKERVPARVQDNNIICHETTLSYQDEIGEQNATLTVLWNGDTFIDKTNVTLYKCQFLGSHTGRPDCSLCQTRDPKYGCVWCHSQCSFVDQCGETRPATTCPPPRIDYIHPISGPVEGGTLVSIEGSNLGASLDEIKDRVSIGGIPCSPIEYNVSIRVICRTGPSPIGPQSALVVIGNRAGVTRAQAKFQYKNIELNEISPKIGPQSGGSRIYLSGKNLNIGSNVAVFLDDLPCVVEKALASNSQLSCRTSAAPYPSYVVSRLLLIIDGANFTLTNPYLYTADPTIGRIEPMQSFFSGGRLLYVTGTQFTSIQQPRLMVFTRKTRSNTNGVTGSHRSPWAPFSSARTTEVIPTVGTTVASSAESVILQMYSQRLVNDSICTVLSSIKMICPSPMINGNLDLLATKLKLSTSATNGPVNIFPSHSNVPISQIPDQLYLQIGFVMDDTLSVLELDSYYPHLDSNMLYVADPVFYSLGNGHGHSIPIGNGEEVLTVKSGDVVVIDGDNLSILPLVDNELNITVGVQKCNLTSVSMRQLVCAPPIYPPTPTDELGRRGLLDLPAVVLRIGNLRRHLGYLHYGEFYGGYTGSGVNHRSEDSTTDHDTRFYHQNAFNRFDNSGGGPTSVVSAPNTGMLNLELLIAVLIVTGTLLAIASIIVLAAYKHKTNEAEREYKRIQLQMDTLENNVRSECKQAFAELQTDILQASGLFSVEELHRMTVPTHDERTFVLRMFFAGTGSSCQELYGSFKDWYNSSIESAYYTYRNVGSSLGLHKPIQNLFWSCSPYFSSTVSEQGMLPTSADPIQITLNPYQHQNGVSTENFYTLNNRGFNPRTNTLKPLVGPTAATTGTLPQQFMDQLFLNRNFVITLVDTLESQKTFSSADRAHFASLLMIILLDRMEYSFDVMRSLLARVIDRLAGTKNGVTSLMMRRNGTSSESIAEVMLINWLSICLFKYAKEVSSGPLFLLYSAIKHQIDKGPVDFVTGMSRYSLSEDRLLREQIEYKTITIYVTVDEKLQHSLPPPPPQGSQQQPLATNKSTIGCRTATMRKPSSTSITTSTINRRTYQRPSIYSTADTDEADEPEHCDKESDGSSPVVLNGPNSSGSSSPGYLCRVLDCDTISQVKAKIIDSLYRCVPHSERPSVPEVTLYWRCLKPKVQSTGASSSATSNNTQQQTSSTSTGTATQNSNSSSSCVVEGGESGNQNPTASLVPAVAAAQAAAAAASTSLYTIQDIYGVASMMSKADADRIYNASRRSDMSLMEMTDLMLEDYDTSTQILTANEAIWRRLNTISHYGITDGAQVMLCLRVNSKQTPLRPSSMILQPSQQQQPMIDSVLQSSRLMYPQSAASQRGQGFGTLPPPPPAPPAQLNHLNHHEMYDTDDQDSNYHLYEQIPAMYNGRDSIYGGLPMPNGNGNFLGTGQQESLYNLSTASSVGQPGRPRTACSNYYHLGSSGTLRTNGPAMTYQTYDVLGYPSRRTPSALGNGTDELYGGIMSRNGIAIREPIYSPQSNYTLSPANHSHQRLLHRNQSQLSASRASANSTSAHHLGLATSNRRRSFARNFYDRLSSLVRKRGGSGRLSGASSRVSSGTLRSTYKYGSAYPARGYRGSRFASDYEDAEHETDYLEEEDEEDEELKHNVWHLVKPSSLIADCIIGASGSFLYDDPNDRKGQRNIRTMRQRRALRRRRRKNPFGLTGNRAIGGTAKTQQLASVAAAALSASQINLNNPNSNQNLPPNLNLSSVRPTSPLSLLTSSASSLFASFFNGNGNSATSGGTSVLPKSIPEIYLTRLLSTKGTIQQYVDDFFGTIFTVNERLPIAVKWLFDFLDQSAERNSITEPDTIQLWKSNSLVYRFWITLLRCPEMLFDVGSTVSIDVCLDVLSSNLIDAAGCAGSIYGQIGSQIGAGDPSIYGGSLSHQGSSRIPKECPPGKLLFARDVPAYRQMISQYYADIAMLPPINESDIIAYMKDVSKTYEGKVCKDRAITELISYCLTYKDAIFAALSAETSTQREHLHLKFESLVYAAAAAGRAGPNGVPMDHTGMSTMSNVSNNNNTTTYQGSNTGVSRV